MKNYNTDNTLCGSHGELWINDVEYAEVISVNIEINAEYGDIDKAKDLAKHKKLLGYECKGEFELNKVDSSIMKFVSDSLKRGKAPRVKLVVNLDDPDALGNERIVVYDALLDKATLADWQVRQTQKEKTGFTFTKWEILESI